MEGKGCVLISINHNTSRGRSRVLEFVRNVQSVIPEATLYEEEGYGLEEYPHVTIFYPLHNRREDIPKLRTYILSRNPFYISFNGFGVFEGGSDRQYDVLYLKLSKPYTDLNEIHDWVGSNCQGEWSHNQYTPHLTLAYVKAGMGRILKDLLSKQFNDFPEAVKVRSIFFDEEGHQHRWLPLHRDITLDEVIEACNRMWVDTDSIDMEALLSGVRHELGVADIEVTNTDEDVHHLVKLVLDKGVSNLEEGKCKKKENRVRETLEYRGEKLQELTINDFRNQIPTFTKRFRKDRDRVRGREPKVAVVVNVKKQKDNLNIYFLTLPTYNDREKEVPTTSYYPPEFKTTNSYTVVVQVVDFFKWLEKPISKMTREDLRQIMRAAEVKFFNTSPAFFLQGFAYWLTQLDSAIKPVNVYPQKWALKHQGIMDKHVGGIVNAFYQFLPDILEQLKAKVKRSHYYRDAGR